MLTPLAIFWLQLLLVIAPLAALARWPQIFPGGRLVACAAAPAVVALGMLAWQPMFWGVVVLDVLLVGVAAIDLLTLPQRSLFSVERTAGRIASLRKDHPITLVVVNHGRWACRLDVRDGVPGELRPQPDVFHLRLSSRSRATLSYELNSYRRGAFTLASTFLMVRSRLNLWRRRLHYSVSTEIHVYPDLKQLSEYALLARTNRLALMGVRRTRKIGQDNEFERLRDYTLDDNYKHIDWRSTARRQKLMVKDFQANQSQRLIFLLDCGRMMTNQAEGLSLLDHGLNSLLMLSYVALTHGDSVGLICFSDEVHAYIPPAGGMRQMNRLLHATFDRFPRLVESRYDLAFRYLGAHCRKRSLVVLITNVIDEVNSLQIEQYLANVVGRHLPLGILLRDHRLFEAVEDEHPRGDDLYRASAAADILSWRQQVLIDLTNKGVLMLDVFPEQMTAPLINRYLDVKARHLL